MIGVCYGTEELLEEGKKTFGVNDFVKEAEIYTKDVFPDLDLGTLFNAGTNGEIDLGFFKKIILNNKFDLAVEFLLIMNLFEIFFW